MGAVMVRSLVTVVAFATGAKVLYKPRSLEVDGAFRVLLTWLDREAALGLHSPQVLDRGEYGWMEFVDWRPSEGNGHLRTFYERQGALIALTYALNAVDLHYENLVATGDCPVLVDLESLFHPAFPNDGPPPNPSERALAKSVIRMGLLPYFSWATGDNRRGIDLSGLGAAQGQEAPFGVPTMEAVETDEMRLEASTPEAGKLLQPPHHPTAFLGRIPAGDRAGLPPHVRRPAGKPGAPAGWRWPVDSLPPRSRSRHSACHQLFSRNQQETYHPDCLRDALDRERLLSALWVAARSQRAYRRIAVTESRALWRGDIPYFWTRVDDTDLRAGCDGFFGDFFSATPWQSLEARLRQLGDEDLERQTWVLRASLATTLQSEGREAALAYVADDRGPDLEGASALEMARAVGDGLQDLALWDEERGSASWIGFSLGMDEESWILTPSQADLYSGVPGIGLFLARLGAAADCEPYESLARGALATTEAIFEGSASSTQCGAFQGLGGWIYTLAHLGFLWGDEELLDRADALLPLLSSAVERDETYDLIGGSAGALLSLLALHEVRPSPAIERVARLCGDGLLEAAGRSTEPWHGPGVMGPRP